VFSELARELKQQGLSTKVVADMFGMALRTYQSRVAQLSATRVGGGSLWEAVHAHIQEQGTLGRAELLRRFARDDGVVVRGVLRDLVDSGLVEQEGRGDATRYRCRPLDAGLPAADDSALLGRMVLVTVHRHGPATAVELAAHLSAPDAAELMPALEALEAQGLITKDAGPAGAVYGCERCIIPLGSAHGWEAAVFDHYQAMVTALVTKLRSGQRRAERSDVIGGSTFVFDLHEGHPLEDEVLGFLEEMRTRGLELRAKLDALAAREGRPDGAKPLRVISYVGQTVAEQDTEGEP
jgi:hypothetical protein